MSLIRFFKLFQRSTREWPVYLEKQGSTFSEEEGIDTGTKWLDGRAIFRKAVDFGGLPNAGGKTVAHGIPPIISVVDMWGQASAVGGNSIHVPNDGTPIRLTVDNSIVGIVTTLDLTAFSTCFVIIDYVEGQPL